MRDTIERLDRRAAIGERHEGAGQFEQRHFRRAERDRGIGGERRSDAEALGGRTTASGVTSSASFAATVLIDCASAWFSVTGP